MTEAGNYVLQARQWGTTNHCSLSFDEKGIERTETSLFCIMIVIGKDGTGNYYINLPASIPPSDDFPLPGSDDEVIPPPDEEPLPEQDPSVQFTFEIDYHDDKMKAYINAENIYLNNDQKTDPVANADPKNAFDYTDKIYSFITLRQGDKIAVCNIKFNFDPPFDITLVTGSLCSRINKTYEIKEIDGKTQKHFHLYLPADISDIGTIIEPSSETPPDPSSEPSEPAPEPVTPPEVTDEKYASFGIAAGINTVLEVETDLIINGIVYQAKKAYKVENGSRIALKDLGQKITIIATQRENEVTCTLTNTNGSLIANNNSGILCTNGLAIEQNTDGYYIGLPNPLPVK